MSTTTIDSIQQVPFVAETISETHSPVVQTKEEVKQAITWKPYEKILFRIAFIFFIALSIPNSPEWYRQVFNIDWTSLHYRDLYDIARFGSGINFFGNTIFGNSLLGYANWIITLYLPLREACFGPVLYAGEKQNGKNIDCFITGYVL